MFPCCGGVMPVSSKVFCGEKFISDAFWVSRDRQLFDCGVFFFDIVNIDENLDNLFLKLCV